MKKAFFFDKDGIFNADRDIPSETGDELYPFCGDVIACLRDAGFGIFIVTNQPAVARGVITERDLKGMFEKFRRALLGQNEGALIDHIYYCPHHPDATLQEYRINCECRKPKPGMLKKAAAEYDIDLKDSFMVGDRISDIIAGYLGGCRTVLCMTGKHLEKIIKTDLKVPEVKADFCIKDISELKNIGL